MKQSEIEALIKKCDFKSLVAAYQKSPEMRINVLKAIDCVGVLEENILGYYACLFLLQLELTNAERAEIHHTAAFVLSQGLNVIDGAYPLGLYHEQMCVELDPENISYKRAILQVFVDVPELEERRTELLKRYG